MNFSTTKPIRRKVSTLPDRRPLMQRKCQCNEKKADGGCQHCNKKNEKILQQKKMRGQQNPKVPDVVDEVLGMPGNQLDGGTRAVMEPFFNHDFSKVRVHTNSKAAESAQAVNAQAYTVGQNMVFNAGRFDPRQNRGRHLLAHELTHVVQQSGTVFPTRDLRIAAPDDVFEKEADGNADQFLKTGMKETRPKNFVQSMGKTLLQRQPSGIPSLIPPLQLSSDEIVIKDGEVITEKNEAIIRMANSFKEMAAANPREYIRLSTYLSGASKLSSVKAAEERSKLYQRMAALKDILVKLGVSPQSVEIEPASAFSDKGGGEITASLYKSPRVFPGLQPQGLPTSAPPVSPASTGPSLSEMLSFKFNAGPLKFAVELPKSVAIKLPVSISAAKTLSFELKAESSGDFSFTIALNGGLHFNVAAKAALKVDKDKGSSGSAGLEITTTKTVCNAPSPESLKTLITSSGEKLTKAMKELETAKPDDRISKLMDIAGAIGEMYDAVDKSKSACKEVPRATINIGVQVPVSPSGSAINDPDPFKRPASVLGASVTIPF